MSAPLRGLYVITPTHIDHNEASTQRDSAQVLAAAVGRAIAGGARAVQYRSKAPDSGQRRAEAAAILLACRAAGVPLIINDDPGLAAELGADGVHIGRDDADLESARAILGPDAIIGVSCYASLDLALRAEQGGASYAAFGSLYPSPTKPHAVRAPLGLLAEARRALRLPLVAIGGISPQNAGPVIAAGADMVAIISGVFAAPDITAAARAYSRLFEPGGRPHQESQV